MRDLFVIGVRDTMFTLGFVFMLTRSSGNKSVAQVCLLLVDLGYGLQMLVV